MAHILYVLCRFCSHLCDSIRHTEASDCVWLPARPLSQQMMAIVKTIAGAKAVTVFDSLHSPLSQQTMAIVKTIAGPKQWYAAVRSALAKRHLVTTDHLRWRTPPLSFLEVTLRLLHRMIYWYYWMLTQNYKPEVHLDFLSCLRLLKKPSNLDSFVF